MAEKKLTVRQKIDLALQLEKEVQDVARPLYEKWHNALTDAVEAIIEKKAGEFSGLLKQKITVKFKDGAMFELKPEYISKEGIFKNSVWKSIGPEVFTIKKIK